MTIFITPYNPGTLQATAPSEEYPVAATLDEVVEMMGEPVRPSRVCIAYPELLMAFSTVRIC